MRSKITAAKAMDEKIANTNDNQISMKKMTSKKEGDILNMYQATRRSP